MSCVKSLKKSIALKKKDRLNRKFSKNAVQTEKFINLDKNRKILHDFFKFMQNKELFSTLLSFHEI